MSVPTLSSTGAKLSFTGFGNGSLWLALITFLYVSPFSQQQQRTPASELHSLLFFPVPLQPVTQSSVETQVDVGKALQ